MKKLQEQFEKETGYSSWINSDIYPDGKIHTHEYVKWLESKAENLPMSNVTPRKPIAWVCRTCNKVDWVEVRKKYFKECISIMMGAGHHQSQVRLAPDDLFDWFKSTINNGR